MFISGPSSEICLIFGIFLDAGDVGDRENGEEESDDSSDAFLGVVEMYLSLVVGDLLEYNGKLKDFVDIGERRRDE